MIDIYGIRFFKNNYRIGLGKLNGADARLLYRYLQTLMRGYEIRYGELLDNNSLISVGNNLFLPM